MKRLILVGLLACLLVGCGSPLIDTWADRGLQGVEYGKQNVTEFADQFQKVLDSRRDSDIDAFFEDILRVGTGRVRGVILDEQWVQEHKLAFKLLLTLWRADETKLDTATKTALDNLDQVAETFEQIKKLRRTWDLNDDQVQIQIAQLTAIIERLVQRSK